VFTMPFSSAGRKKFAAHVALLLVDIVVLALSARVNRFQEFFYAADLFPFALSIITLVVLCSAIALDFATEDAYTGRAQIEIGYLGILSVLWLASNIFSTSRWRFVPLICYSIPAEFPDEGAWCRNLQALKAFVWIEFLLCFLTMIVTLRYSIMQNAYGNKHIWQMPLSRYWPRMPEEKASYTRDREFLPFE